MTIVGTAAKAKYHGVANATDDDSIETISQSIIQVQLANNTINNNMSAITTETCELWAALANTQQQLTNLMANQDTKTTWSLSLPVNNSGPPSVIIPTQLPQSYGININKSHAAYSPPPHPFLHTFHKPHNTNMDKTEYVDAVEVADKDVDKSM